jgi:hypothetical protein
MADDRPLENAIWRASRNPHRSTIHVMVDNEPSEDDPVIGLMISRELALEAVLRHNEAVGARRPRIKAIPRHRRGGLPEPRMAEPHGAADRMPGDA